MSGVITWITTHPGELAGIAAAFVLFFDRLAKLTPTTKDDGAVSLLYKVFAVLGVKVKDNSGA